MLTGVRWVASPPDALRPRAPRRPRRPYAGPPRYRAIPRWSLRTWMPAPAPGPHGPLATPPPRPPERALRANAGLLARLAATTAVLALVTALAELWRYGLLIASRDQALPPDPLAFSDALVALFGLLTPVTALVTGALFLRWLHQARELAATISRTRPSRRSWAVVLGAVVPGPNLWVPGSALTEVEHAASGRPTTTTPRPSRPVLRWWVAWDVSVVLGIVAVLRGLGTSTQAMADAVLLHALADVAAGAAALATAAVVTHLTELLAPELRVSGRESVLALGPTPADDGGGSGESGVDDGSGAGEGGVAAGRGRGGRVGAGTG